jgi:formiminotetrahydrofolate cyclodeaminase
MHDASIPIRDFLDAAAARQSTPGGGSVAALVGALGASMGEMVVNYSVGKEDLAVHEPRLRAAVREFARARAILLRLMEEDQSAYETISALRKLPTDNPDRQSRFPAALLACICVPQAIAATALAILDLSADLVEKVNAYLLSDLAVCAELSMATVRCGTYNVRINLGDITDAAERARLRQEADAMALRAAEIVRRVIPTIWKRAENA